MQFYSSICGLLLFIVISCTTASNQVGNNPKGKVVPLVNENGTILSERINPPEGFTRIMLPENSFAEYLRNLPLKPHGSNVKLYNGQTKQRKVHTAVIDLPVGNKNLHQCADAIIHLRARYLYEHKRYDDIHFHLTNGFLVDFSRWQKGFRVQVEGNKTSWVKSAPPSSSYETFWKYLEFVFTYAGTYSLSKETEETDYSAMNPGDIFIQGGFPGHAVIVVDMAINDNGEKIYLLAQSYMPAQELHILKNLNDPEISPWYVLQSSEPQVMTPEWTFKTTDLRRFKED